MFARLAQIDGECDIHALADEAADYFVESHAADVLHLSIGSPAFMWALAQEFASYGTSAPRVVFSHSTRQSVDVAQPDGRVRKQAVFVFECFLHLIADFAR